MIKDLASILPLIYIVISLGKSLLKRKFQVIPKWIEIGTEILGLITAVVVVWSWL